MATFNKFTPGCDTQTCCGGTSGPQQICVNVLNCAGAPEASIPVTITGPGVSGSGTTDASGQYCWNVPPGTYTVTATFATIASSKSATVALGDPTLFVPFTDPGSYTVLSMCVDECGGTTGAGLTQVSSVTISPSLTPATSTYPCYAWTLPNPATFPYVATVHYQDKACCSTSLDGVNKTKTVTINDFDACHGSGFVGVDITSGIMCVTVVSCGTSAAPLVGATVTSVSGGSGTTDSTGKCCLSGTPNTASGNVTVSHGRYSSKTVSGGTFGCAGPATIDMTANILSGYGPASGGANCCTSYGDPIEYQSPAPLMTYTDSGGTVSAPLWSACGGVTGPNDCNGTAQSCHHNVFWSCPSGTSFTVINKWYAEDCYIGGVTHSGTRMHDNASHDCASQGTGGPTNIVGLQVSATATITSAPGSPIVATGTWASTTTLFGQTYDIPGAGSFVIAET